ncbi:hypothetical protein BJ165DRAFT_214949 [Panaeolus papilionaceus]|nr:hypothetical protein BJ165DRAFT_214949 [Panaeolus papilionaceus]
MHGRIGRWFTPWTWFFFVLYLHVYFCCPFFVFLITLILFFIPSPVYFTFAFDDIRCISLFFSFYLFASFSFLASPCLVSFSLSFSSLVYISTTHSRTHTRFHSHDYHDHTRFSSYSHSHSIPVPVIISSSRFLSPFLSILLTPIFIVQCISVLSDNFKIFFYFHRLFIIQLHCSAPLCRPCSCFLHR